MIEDEPIEGQYCRAIFERSAWNLYSSRMVHQHYMYFTRAAAEQGVQAYDIRARTRIEHYAEEEGLDLETYGVNPNYKAP